LVVHRRRRRVWSMAVNMKRRFEGDEASQERERKRSAQA
jgi:hypothetical protein